MVATIISAFTFSFIISNQLYPVQKSGHICKFVSPCDHNKGMVKLFANSLHITKEILLDNGLSESEAYRLVCLEV